MKKIKTIVSLFDGISCGLQAIKEEGIDFENYFASEIYQPAIKISDSNHPEIIRVGDVRTIDCSKFGKVNLLLGGSPCQDFTFMGKKRGMSTKEGIQILDLDHYLKLKEEGFEFVGQSYLFWEYVNVFLQTKPDYFILENVVMPNKWRDLISEIMGVQPILINSSALVPQNRARYYWTNIPVTQPEDRSPKLSDYFPQAVTGVGFRGRGDKSLPVKNGKVGYQIIKDVRKDNIANAVLTRLGGLSKTGKWNGTGHYLTVDGMIKTFSSAEAEQLQGLPKGYTNVSGVSEGLRIHGIGNGWTVPVIRHLLSGIPDLKKTSARRNPTWEERQEFEKERSGQPAAPWSHVPKGW